jgi:hypothetical protein
LEDDDKPEATTTVLLPPPVAQIGGKFLDPTKHIAWGKAAVAADPEYWNAHNILSLGYEYAHEYGKALKSLEIAKSLGGWQENIFRDGSSSTILERFDRLYEIVHGDKQEANSRLEWTLWSRKTLAQEAYSMQVVPVPDEICNACFWPGDHRCSRCKSVHYCSKVCQKLLWKDHKKSCVER